jgi:glucose/mannose-6-phosphate isomerase
VLLDDSDLHPRVRSRIELTRSLIEPAAAGTHVLAGEGETRTERIFSLVLLGDLVSVYLAVLRGIDPTPVSALDELKSELAGAG